MNRRMFRWLAAPLLGLSLAATAAHAAPSSIAQPFGISLSPSVELIGAPCSVDVDALESNQFIRAFPERLAYALPADITVTGPDGAPTLLAKGTLVDSYFVHADWINKGRNMAKKLAGSLTFDQPVLGVIKDSAGLMGTHAALGAPSTTYATASDQGLETWADDALSFSDAGQTVNLKLTVYNSVDQLRVITKASPAITHSEAAEVVGSPCSVVENTFESDDHIRVFAERQSYALPEDVTVRVAGGATQVIAKGTLVNSYYAHADWRNGGENAAKLFAGSVSFAQPVLGVVVDAAGLEATHATLGAPGTAYSASADQGLESYDDSYWFSNSGQTVNLKLTVWNSADQVRIITLAQ